MPIDQLELSQRTYNCLKRSQITRVGQILERSSDELLQLRNFGQKSLKELQEKLRQHGLGLPGADEALGGTADEDEESEEFAATSGAPGEYEELGGDVLAGDLIVVPDDAEETDELLLSSLAADDLEDDEEPLGPKPTRAKPARARRGEE